MSSSEIHSASASYFQIGPTGGINFSEGSTAKWDITRSGDTSARQVVSYWSTDGDYSTSSMDAAIVNLDFEKVNSSVIFNESETIKTVSAEVFTDDINERNEWFNMNISVEDNGGVESIVNTSKYGVYINNVCLLYTSPSPRDLSTSRMPSSA